MTPRTRRLLAIILAVALLLFAGRWLTSFLAARWWAAAISPGALAVVTRWQLLGLALDLAAVLTASAWFALQGVLVAGAIGSVQVQRQVGTSTERVTVPPRILILGALVAGVILGIVTGAGAGAWRAPVSLALDPPRYGVVDPLLGTDLGVLVANYPVWRALHGFVLLLVLLGLVFATSLYAAIGAFKHNAGRLEIHPDARRHLGGLLTLLALVLAAGFLLAPYRLATGIDAPPSSAAATTLVLAAHAAAGAALAAALLTVGWLVRGRHTLLTSGWLVLALAAIAERLVVPSFVAEAGSFSERANLARQFDSLLYHITLEDAPASGDTLPSVASVWDAEALASWTRSIGEELRGAAPGADGLAPAWLVVSQGPPGQHGLALRRVAEGRVTPAGLPVVLDSTTAVTIPRSVPGAIGWQQVPGGVPVGGILRRIALAWALQAPGILGLGATATIDWDRDPRERLERLAPALTWREDGAIAFRGRLTWLLTGWAVVERAPMAARIELDGRTVSGMVPSLVALVDAETGGVRIFADPAADPLGERWAAVHRGLVERRAALPSDVVSQLPYPVEWFQRQLEVLQRPHWSLGVLPRDRRGDPEVSPASIPLAGGVGVQQGLEDPEHTRTIAILTARRVAGVPRVEVRRLAIGTMVSADRLRAAWSEMAPLRQMVDSVRAAGDTLLAGPIRWHVGPAGVFAWQPHRSAGRAGAPALLWVSLVTPGGTAGVRRPEAALQALTTREISAPDGAGTPDALGRLQAVRSWVRLADSALARGDLTAFSRAWEALRGLLLDTIPE